MLQLLTPTDPTWVRSATRDLPGLLSDHAHCELKAAHSALALLSKFGCEAPCLIEPLSELAKEETVHFQQVIGHLGQRGSSLARTEPNRYVRALWDATKADRHRDGVLLDRLLTAALVEARSCERFTLLATHLEDEDLRAFYRDLMESEARHYRLYCRLAEELFGAEDARNRLAELAELEKGIVDSLPLGPRVHG